MKRRLDLLDATKGICIILMTISHFPKLYTHTFISNLNHTALMAFKMPLFFMISGYLINLKRNLVTFIRFKADALLKTTLNILLLFCFVLFMKNLDGTIFLHLLHSLRNGSLFPMEVALYPLWFPVVLFFSLLIVRTILVADARMSKLHSRTLTILIYITLLLCYHFHLSFYFLDILIFSVGFMHVGAYLRARIAPQQLESFCNRPIVFGFSAAIFVVLCIYSTQLNLNLNIGIASGEKIGDHMLLTLIKTAAGAYTVLYLTLQSTKIMWFKRFLLKCAKASLVILAFHIKVTDVIFKLAGQFGHPQYVELLIFIANILICLFLFQVFSRIKLLKSIFLPSYNGNTRSNPRKISLKISISNGYYFLLERLSSNTAPLFKAR